MRHLLRALVIPLTISSAAGAHAIVAGNDDAAVVVAGPPKSTISRSIAAA